MSDAPWETYLVGYGLLRKEGKILVVGQRWRWSPMPDLVWTLPGGRAEPGEAIGDAVRREVGEETGLTVEPGRLLYVIEAIYRSRRQRFVSFVFAVEQTGGRLGPDGDEYVVEACFLEPAEVERRIAFETFREPLRRYLAAPEAPAFYTRFEL